MPLQILDRVYRITLPIPFPLATTNVYFINESPRTLVDTGIKTEVSFGRLQGELESLGVSLSSIERILVTHGHIDHYGLAQKIASLSGATIYLHDIEYGKLRSMIHSLGFLKRILLRNGVHEELVNQALRFIEINQGLADSLDQAFFLKDGDTIPFQSMTWKAIHCPGHSPGLLCYHWPEEKILFTGDHLLKEITPNPVLNISEDQPPFRYLSLKEYLSSLKKIEALDIALLLPGHGEEVRDAKGLIRKIFDHHRERMELVLRLVSEREKTAFEISSDLFPGVPPFEVFLGISEALGHLEILKEEGRVSMREKEGIDYYSSRA